MPTVLLVDDEPDMLFVWRHVLTNAGYKVRVAADGVAALEQLRDGPANLVITDWMMPRMNGAELCRAIRADRELCDTPLLVFTAVLPPFRDRRCRASRLGMNGSSSQPVATTFWRRLHGSASPSDATNAGSGVVEGYQYCCWQYVMVYQRRYG
jgi:CheY-like chemotaxis protein